MVERLTAAQRRLAEREVVLAVGVSTVHKGLAAVPAAYREALEARTLLAGRPGTIAERTGVDMRRVGDVVELLIAAQLAALSARGPSAPHATST